MVKVKNFVLLAALLLFSLEGYCADPPSPSPPPPVGLPLPIDDHLPILLLAGILLGAFFVRRMKSA